MAAETRIDVIVQSIDRVSAGINKIVDDIERKEKRYRKSSEERAARARKREEEKRRKANQLNLMSMQSASMAMDRVAYASRESVMWPLELAANFEHATNRVKAHSGGAFGAEQLAAIQEEARRLGSATEFTATDAMNTFDVLTKAGLNFQQQLGSVGRVLDFATFGEMEMADAAERLVNVMSVYGFMSQDVNQQMTNSDRVAGGLARAANAATTNIGELAFAMSYGGKEAKIANISFEDTLTAMALLAKANMTGSRGGTVFRNAVQSLMNPRSRGAAEAMKRLGVSAQQLKDTIGKGDIAAALRLIADATAKLDAQKKQGYLKAIFGRMHLAGAVHLMEAVTLDEKSTESWASVSAAVNDTSNTIADRASEMRSGTKGLYKEFVSAAEEMGIVIGETMQPSINALIRDARDAARTFGEWAKENPELVTTLSKVAIGTAGVSTVLTGLLPLMITLHLLCGPKGIAGVSGALIKSLYGSAVATKTLSGAMVTAKGSMLGFMGVAGNLAMAAAAGYGLGTLIDRWLGLSDAISGAQKNMETFHNSGTRFTAKPEDLTKEEIAELNYGRKQLDALDRQIAALEQRGSTVGGWTMQFMDAAREATFGSKENSLMDMGTGWGGQSDWGRLRELREQYKKKKDELQAINERALQRGGVKPKQIESKVAATPESKVNVDVGVKIEDNRVVVTHPDGTTQVFKTPELTGAMMP